MVYLLHNHVNQVLLVMLCNSPRFCTRVLHSIYLFFVPDVAEWVLNKCALEEVDDSDIADFIDYDSEGTKLQLQGHTLNIDHYTE